MSIVLISSSASGGGIPVPTYAPNDALTKITPQLGNVVLDATAKGVLCDDAHRIIWNLCPWRWERKELTAFSVTDNTQDYTAAVPSDFMSLLQCELVRTDASPNQVYPLEIKRIVYRDQTTKVFPFGEICFLQELNSGAGGFRTANAGLSSGMTAQIRGVYRKLPSVKYTSANLTTTFPELPDQYFYLFQEWLLWCIYRYIGDPRAGIAQIASNGRWQYTGQIGVAMSLTEQAIQNEDLADTESVFPADNLGFSGGGARIFP